MEKQTLDQIIRLLQRSEDLDAAAPELLKHLGPALDCGWAALWETVHISDSLRILASWQDPSVQSREFKDFTIQWHPDYGEGMVGKAWRTLQLQVSLNLIQEMSLPRSLYARSAGLVSGVWVPIQSPRRGFVLECLLKSTPRESLVQTLQNLAAEIADSVERKRKGQ
jgi:hypothetical protein